MGSCPIAIATSGATGRQRRTLRFRSTRATFLETRLTPLAELQARASRPGVKLLQRERFLTAAAHPRVLHKNPQPLDSNMKSRARAAFRGARSGHRGNARLWGEFEVCEYIELPEYCGRLKAWRPGVTHHGKRVARRRYAHLTL